MPDEIDKLQGVPLPPKVQCDRCRKHMMFTRFSIKQLTDYRYQIKNNVRNPHLPKCQKCAGGHQVVEIECTMCHKTKGMEEFAKSQRNVADTAVCK
jgi:DNA repair protein RAD7